MPEEKLLSLFWDLAVTDEVSRIKAAVQLIAELRKCREVQDAKIDEEEDEDGGSDCEEMEYTVKRLIRGLGSGRKAARQGFATALTEYFMEFNVEPEKVFKIMDETLQTTGSAKGQEARNAYFGQVFGLVALSRALLSKKVDDNLQVQKTIIGKLKDLGSKKSYLVELCSKAVSDIIIESGEVVSSKLLHAVEDDVYYGWDYCTPEVLFTALTVQRHLGESLDHNLIKSRWKHMVIADSRNYTKLAKVLQDSTGAHPRVHSVWKEVLWWVLDHSKGDFQLFWKEVVDENLFQTTHERKYLGFKLAEEVVPRLHPSQVGLVFSTSLMRCLFNSLSSTQNYLNSAVKHFVDSLPSVAAKCSDKEAVAEMVMSLVGRHGNVHFDNITKTKTTEKLLGQIGGKGAQRYSKWLLEVFRKGSSKAGNSRGVDQHERTKTQEWVFNQFLLLVKCKSIPRTVDWLKDIIIFWFDLAFFKTPEQEELPEPLHQICQQRFFSALTELASERKTQDEKQEGVNWALVIMKHAHKMLQVETNTIISPKWNEEAHAVFNSVYKDVKSISKESQEEPSPLNQAFELLFLYIGLQLFSESDQALDLLKEVQACYKEVKSKKKKKVKEDEPHWMEVLVEVLLSILTQPSSLLRHVVDQVFQRIAPHMTAQALQIILEALDPGQEGSDADDGLQVVNDDEEEEEEDVEHEGDESTQVPNGKASDEESEEESEEEEEEEEEGNEVDEAFRAEVKAALGKGALDNEDSGQESEDEDMDDDAMMAVDEALSAVFKERLKAKQLKKDKKDLKKTLLHYKQRVLDIVEIFVKKQADNPLILDLVEPLLVVIQVSLSSKDYVSLGERAQGIFRNKLCNIREYPPASALDAEQVHKSLEKLMTSAKKARSLNMVSLISKGCLFLVRVLNSTKVDVETNTKVKRKRKSMGEPAEKQSPVSLLDSQRVMTSYNEALKDFMCNRGTHLHPVLFTELIGRYPILGWEMAPHLIQYITEAVNAFRKGQACHMLWLLLCNKVDDFQLRLKGIANPMENALIKFLSLVSEEEAAVKGKKLKEILKMASRFFKEIMAMEDGKDLIDVTRVNDAIEKAISSPAFARSNELRNSCTRLSALLTGGSSQENKGGKPKKKRKKTKATKDDSTMISQ